MYTRIRRVIASSVRPFTQTRSIYHQAQNAETTELHTLTARSNDDLSIGTPNMGKSIHSKDATLEESGKPIFAHRYRQRFSGWRFGVLNFTIWASAVFLINSIVTIWGSVAHKASEDVLSEGNCGRVKTLNSGIHILINVLSTILLSGSNYCMQCLSAPTRGEIDKAHAAHKWLDVGVPSVRNLRHISRRRLVLWLLLGSSSLPLHLLYNSAVYASLSTNSYDVFLVSEAFLDDPECRNCTGFDDPYAETPSNVLTYLWLMSRNGSLDRLEPAQCVTEYATMIQSNRRNLLLVASNEKVESKKRQEVPPEYSVSNNTNVYWFSGFQADIGLRQYENDDSYSWICSGLNYSANGLSCMNRVEEVKANPWEMAIDCTGPEVLCNQYRYPVDYCLSELAPPLCKLHFSLVVAIIVTTLNFFKAMLMFYIVYSTNENPLMTMGDAVASFLDERDTSTNNMGLHSIHDYKKDYAAGASLWNNPCWRWKDVTSKKRRITTLLLFAIALSTIVALLIWGVREINQRSSTGTSTILRLGFGAVDSRALISSNQFPTDMVLLALIANSPQILLSFLYFAYNSLFTAMLMGYEWTSYAYKRKGLRISRKPSGFQRSTYFLQLPYRFGLPLVVLSGTLHWLVSQSIFVVALDPHDEYGNFYETTDYIMTKTCGYSPIAMLTVVIVGTLMVVAVVAFGYIPYKRGMPLAGSCSLAISAACHPEQDRGTEASALSEQKLQWGVVSTGVDGVGHCAFSSKEIGPLVKGQMYA